MSFLDEGLPNLSSYTTLIAPPFVRIQDHSVRTSWSSSNYRTLQFPMQLSEESKEVININPCVGHFDRANLAKRISRIIDISRVTIHYGWIPLVIYLGTYANGPR